MVSTAHVTSAVGVGALVAVPVSLVELVIANASLVGRRTHLCTSVVVQPISKE